MKLNRFGNNRILRAIVLALVISLIGVIFAGCGNSGTAADVSQIKIGVITYDDYDTFITAMTKEMSEWCKAKEKETGVAIMLDVVSAKNNQLTQNDEVEKFVSKRYDLICVNLVDRTDPTVIIDKAKAADVPVIFFNRELVQEDLERWDKLYYVGSEPEEAGQMQAQIIIDDLKDSDFFDEVDTNNNGVIQYVMLEGEAGHKDAAIRTKICIDTLKDSGILLDKLGDEIANWNKAQAHTKMSNLLEKYPVQIEMVIANNDDMAMGALEAIEEKNPTVIPYVIGVNGTEEALEAVRVRRLNGTVYNDYIGQADAIMSLAYILSTHGEVPSEIKVHSATIGRKSVPIRDGRYIYLPHEKITYDNVHKYIK